MSIPQTPMKIKLLSTKQVIALATEFELIYDQPEMISSPAAQRLKTKLKKFADRIQLLTAENFEDRILDID